MTSQIQQTLMQNYKEMQMLIEKQIFNIEDAQLFLKEYHKVIMKLEDLEASRDNWRSKYEKLKNSLQNGSNSKLIESTKEVSNEQCQR